MNTRVIAVLILAAASASAFASPIKIRVPSTPPFSGIDIKVGGNNDAEGDHDRTAHIGGGLSPKSASQNADTLAARINSDPNRIYDATIDPLTPGTVKITPILGSSEPTITVGAAAGLDCPEISFSRDPRPGTPDMDEIGFITLASFTSVADGNGLVGISCGDFSAKAMTYSGMTGSELMADLSAQLSAQGAMVQLSADSLTLCGLGDLRSWTSDAALGHSVIAGSMVPTPGSSLLALLGLSMVTRRRR